MVRPRRFAAVTLLAVVLTGCVTMKVASQLESGVDITSYRTFAWGPPEAGPTGDARLDNNPFFHDYLKNAVNMQLVRKGFQVAPAAGAAPDLLLHYHASVNQRIDIVEVDRLQGYCYQDCRPGIIDYEQGTIVIDVVDAKSKKVIWRGWAQDIMQGLIDNQVRLEREIDQVVTRMLESFPGRL